MPPSNLAHEVLRQLQVALRTGQTGVAKIGGQKGQFRAEIGVLFTPQQQPEHRERMPQIMEANAPLAAHPLNASRLECLTEGSAKGRDGILFSSRTEEERMQGQAGAEVLRCQHPTARQVLNQTRRDRDRSRFSKLRMPDMKQAFVKIYISLSEPQQFSSSQSSQKENSQGRAQHCIASGRDSVQPRAWRMPAERSSPRLC
jgi:hypothetical protein